MTLTGGRQDEQGEVDNKDPTGGARYDQGYNRLMSRRCQRQRVSERMLQKGCEMLERDVEII